MQHAPINDPTRHRFQKVGMRNAPEVVREIGVDDVLSESRMRQICMSVSMSVAPCKRVELSRLRWRRRQSLDLTEDNLLRRRLP